MQLAARLVIFTKKTGTAPRNSPIVVNPNASPGAFGKTDTSTASVTDIVMLKNITPVSEMSM